MSTAAHVWSLEASAVEVVALVATELGSGGRFVPGGVCEKSALTSSAVARSSTKHELDNKSNFASRQRSVEKKKRIPLKGSSSGATGAFGEFRIKANATSEMDGLFLLVPSLVLNF